MLKKLLIIFYLTLFTVISPYVFAEKQKETIADENELLVFIDKPIAEVFKYVTNPHNTSSWVDSITVEKTSEWPPRVGTIYKNKGKSGNWSSYKVSKYEVEKEFELIKNDDSTYHVNYNFSSTPSGETKLIYHEWVTKGKIKTPFTQNELIKLKKKLEHKQDAEATENSETKDTSENTQSSNTAKASNNINAAM